MIESFTLENFKSFKKATLPLAPLTLLVGPNASGKSNAIEGLELLAWLADGYDLKDLAHAAREGEIDFRGDLGRSFHNPDEPMHLEVKVRVSSTDGSCPYRLSIQREDGVATLAGRSFCGEDIRATRNFSGRLIYGSVEEHEQQFFATQIAVNGIRVLHPVVRKMRGYSKLTEHELQADGSNVSTVLYQLATNGYREDVLAFVRSLPEQDISDINFVETSVGDVMVQLEESFGGQKRLHEAAVLSDGTLRVLHIAAAMLTALEGSLIVLEEVDTGVHPSRARLLLENLHRVAHKRNIKILLTTHNPALQDALPNEAVPDVVACYRDPDTGESKLQRLEDLERYPHLVARGSLGELSTNGTLEKFLKDKTTPEERRAKEQEWIERLRLDTGT